MIQEYKRLLIKDLSACIPYGVKVQEEKYKGVFVVNSFGKDPYGEYVVNQYVHIERIKPYLRSMSDISEKEIKEYHSLQNSFYSSWHAVDWLLAHFFDFHGLISIGLALPAPEGMYDIKK